MIPIERAARAGSGAIRLGFVRYRRDFRDITGRARNRFEQRDWIGGQQDASERLELYRRILKGVKSDLRRVLGELLEDPVVWRAMKTMFAERMASDPDQELGETFFNSTTRLVFSTVGVDPSIEFVDLDPRRDRYGTGKAVHRRYRVGTSLGDMVRLALIDFRHEAPYRDIEGDVELVGSEIERRWSLAGGVEPPEAVELVESVFYRGTGAYMVGRITGSGRALPLVLVLLHRPEGVEVDAVLMDEAEVSVVFSYTRSHFRVAAARPSELIRFLRTIMPRKPIAELYISIGHPKHGKTELYRDLLGHLGRSMDRFQHAPGDAGMVMIVFTLRSHDYVFKVIRDHFAHPKTTTRDEVRRRYQLVFEHDRAGRLIEAQEFEHLSFDAWRFAPELLEELSQGASRTVTVDGDCVTIHHLYIERRVEPLNLFLRRADDGSCARAVLEYGQAIRDLAATNIFPGDLLLKNFGVTRQGRVTFYDYDELCLVTDCTFRDLPAARDDGEEMSAEPWFYVGAHDIFPEEFIRFLSFSQVQRQHFLGTHAEVLTADFWRDLKRRHKRSEVLDVFPYPPSRRLKRKPAARANQGQSG